MVYGGNRDVHGILCSPFRHGLGIDQCSRESCDIRRGAEHGKPVASPTSRGFSLSSRSRSTGTFVVVSSSMVIPLRIVVRNRRCGGVSAPQLNRMPNNPPVSVASVNLGSTT